MTHVEPTIVRDALLPLVGLPLFDSNRAADMQSFSFGEAHDLPFRFPRPGKPTSRKVGEYALHVQCTWRLVGPAGIEVVSRNRFESVADSSHRDARIKHWLATVHNVVDVTADRVGGITLSLTEGYALEVIADHTRDAELWRFFRTIDESPHFVMTGEGIET